MKQLIIVRNGYYDEHNFLTETGSAEIGILCRNLAPLIAEGTLMILSSPAPCALQSAVIIGDTFKAKVEHQAILLSDKKHKPDIRGALALIRSRSEKADVIIVVTHYEFAKELPHSLAAAYLKIPLEVSRTIPKGGAMILDCAKKSAVLV